MGEVKEHQLLSDNPVTLERDDKFGFKPYVNILGHAILDTESLPFTVGIFGGWGTGKTSLMHLLRNWLDERYLFSWHDVPGADNESLLSFLRDDLTFLFRISSNFKRDLENNRISDDLKKVFNDNKHPLSTNAKITTADKNEWKIEDKEKEYKIKESKFCKKLNICDPGWTGIPEICKSNSGKTIRIVNDKNSAKIRINDKKEKATLKIKGGRTYNLKVKKENGKRYFRRYGYNTIWFNPWKYDNKEVLWTALIRSILLEIRNKTHIWQLKLKKTAWALLKDISLFAFKGGFSVATGGIISLRNIEKMGESEHDFLNKFESKFSQLVEDFVGEKGRLVVFIDDLDRCIPENAITVLESLKLYLDNSRCVFVLGMDREIVELGIKQRYHEDVQLSGREYLEKIVQLPFFLPPIQFENLKRVLLLQPQCKAANYTSEIWNLLYYGLGENPRKVKRFVNSFFMAQGARKYLEDKPSTDDKTGNIKEGVSDEDQLFFFILPRFLLF